MEQTVLLTILLLQLHLVIHQAQRMVQSRILSFVQETKLVMPPVALALLREIVEFKQQLMVL